MNINDIKNLHCPSPRLKRALRAFYAARLEYRRLARTPEVPIGLLDSADREIRDAEDEIFQAIEEMQEPKRRAG